MGLLQSEVRRLEGELDTVRRERDALQLEMSLVQVSSGKFLRVSVLEEAGLSTYSDFLGIVQDLPISGIWDLPLVNLVLFCLKLPFPHRRTVSHSVGWLAVTFRLHWFKSEIPYTVLQYILITASPDLHCS